MFHASYKDALLNDDQQDLWRDLHWTPEAERNTFARTRLKATIRNGQGADMGSQLGDGILDAFCFGAGLPIPIFSQARKRRSISLIPRPVRSW